MPDSPKPSSATFDHALTWLRTTHAGTLSGERIEMLVEEIERLQLALGARNTEVERIWIDEIERLRAAGNGLAEAIYEMLGAGYTSRVADALDAWRTVASDD